MELALRGLRGLGVDQASFASCFTSTPCRAEMDAWCYSGGYFGDPVCPDWRTYRGPLTDAAPLPAPSTPKPPIIDTRPGSPTYGQAAVTLPDGTVVVVDKPEDALRMYDQQIADKAAADRAAVQAAMNAGAAAQCTLTAADCGMFTSVNADCSGCSIDFSKPAVMLVLFAAMGLLIALKK